MHLYTNYALERGLESEAAVSTALTELVGKSLVERKKRTSLRRTILGFFHAKQNDEIDGKHTDFVVSLESDVNKGVIGVPIQAKSSLKGALTFMRKCRLYRWGHIEVVVVEECDLVRNGDDPETIRQKTARLVNRVKEALIRGYNRLRKEICDTTWRTRSKLKLRRLQNRRNHHSEHEQWCPHFNMARMCCH